MKMARNIIEDLQTVIDSLDRESLLSSSEYGLVTAALEIERTIKSYLDAIEWLDGRSIGWKFDSFIVNDIIVAEAQLKLWNEVVENSSPSEDELTITLDGIRHVAAGRAKRLVHNWDSARSTDAVSNAISYVEAEVNSSFVRTYGSDLTIKEVR